MSTAAVKIPQPLSGVEIKNGLAVRMANTVPGLDEEERKNLRVAIRLSLNNTCSLNESSHSKFKATWRVWRNDEGAHGWWVDYNLDDFGRPVIGGIGGGAPRDEKRFWTGAVEEMPPDKFRRETEQPIPAPQIVRKQETGKGTGISRATGKRGGRSTKGRV